MADGDNKSANLMVSIKFNNCSFQPLCDALCEQGALYAGANLCVMLATLADNAFSMTAWACRCPAILRRVNHGQFISGGVFETV